MLLQACLKKYIFDYVPSRFAKSTNLSKKNFFTFKYNVSSAGKKIPDLSFAISAELYVSVHDRIRSMADLPQVALLF